MRLRSMLIVAAVLCLAGSAHAATKFYDQSATNGLQADFLNTATNLCPPVQTSPGILQGVSTITDNGTGTVTLEQNAVAITTFIDLGPEALTITFGPGAFIFIDAILTETIASPHESNASGVGAHGPSGTAPGESAEWGIVSGFMTTGRIFCLSSPITVCNGAEFAHGTTIPPLLPSATYDLGTWNFDAEGDYSTESPHIQRTSNGGLQNSRYDLKGAFVGASLPALPLVGFGALALGLAVIGGRALLGKK
jgi:hypothetical protein